MGATETDQRKNWGHRLATYQESALDDPPEFRTGSVLSSKSESAAHPLASSHSHLGYKLGRCASRQSFSSSVRDFDGAGEPYSLTLLQPSVPALATASPFLKRQSEPSDIPEGCRSVCEKMENELSVRQGPKTVTELELTCSPSESRPATTTPRAIASLRPSPTSPSATPVRSGA